MQMLQFTLIVHRPVVTDIREKNEFAKTDGGGSLVGGFGGTFRRSRQQECAQNKNLQYRKHN